MRIAVLSGKGGTGKTFVSTNLAYAAGSCTYVDCDIEEPNGAIFLKPDVDFKEKVYVAFPQPVEENCTGCRECVKFCKFNALAYIKDRVKVFTELCHDCGGCIKVCTFNALREKNRAIGHVEFGRKGKISTRSGILHVGEVTGVPIIKRLLKNLPDNSDIIIDCPPGSACTVMESIEESDFCVLVTEPTTFGIHNLNMVYELVKMLSIPHAVVINKASAEDNVARNFCIKNNIPVLASIPFNRDIAKLASDGNLVAEDNRFSSIFDDLYKSIREACEK